MKALLLFSALFITAANPQNNKAGLYGLCDYEDWGYRCQQMVLNKDSTFIFYDLLHLQGWQLSKGTWSKRKDTIILNSTSHPFHIVYDGYSTEDSVLLEFRDPDTF